MNSALMQIGTNMALVEPFFKFETIILPFYHGLSISGNTLIHTALRQCYSSDCCLSIMRAGAGLRFENQTVICLIKCPAELSAEVHSSEVRDHYSTEGYQTTSSPGKFGTNELATKHQERDQLEESSQGVLAVRTE